MFEHALDDAVGAIDRRPDRDDVHHVRQPARKDEDSETDDHPVECEVAAAKRFGEKMRAVDAAIGEFGKDPVRADFFGQLLYWARWVGSATASSGRGSAPGPTTCARSGGRR